MDLTKIKAYLESDEGKLDFKQFMRQQNYDSIVGAKRIDKMLSHLDDKELEEWFKKFFKWERKYEDRKYEEGIITSSLFFNALHRFISEKGICVFDQYNDEDFLAYAEEWRGYVFKLYIGQGSFVRIEKNGDIIFQTG